MKRVIVFCEGPTEETFVNKILSPAFYDKRIFISARNFGGVSRYSIIKKHLTNLCKSDTSAYITTMLDYYGLPFDTPGKKYDVSGDIYQKVQYVEQCIGDDIKADNLLPNLILHEFEALLFSRPEAFLTCGMPPKVVDDLCKIRHSFQTPEHINNSPDTAPSKRILSIYPRYSKIVDGYQISSEIGLDTIRSECGHFAQWMKKLEDLSTV